MKLGSRVIVRWMLATACLLGSSVAAHAVTLFDAAAGLPTAQGWSTLSIGNAGAEALSSGVYSLDSTGAGVDTWGKARFSPITLDTASGFELDFTLRLLGESHSNVDRAGFSMLFVGADPTHSLELAFWSDQAFVYAHTGGAFVHGVGAALDTTNALHSYSLVVAAQLFTLSVDGTPLFGGSLQNYTPQGLPYTAAGFMFFGDDTSSGAASVQLGAIQLAAVPEVSLHWLWLAGLGVVLLRAYRRKPR